MAVQTLITPFEVVLYSPAGRQYPLDKICDLIPRIEQEFGHECLGETLYDWMIANVDYPGNATVWQCGYSYEIGEFVIKEGTYFENTVALNTDDPTAEDSGWVIPERFGANECANTLWNDHLRYILALKIYARSLNFTTRETGAKGLTMLEGSGAYGNQGVRSGTKAELSDYKKDLIIELDTAVANMMRWARKTNSSLTVCTAPISSMIACVDGLCAPASNSRRRWGFAY